MQSLDKSDRTKLWVTIVYEKLDSFKFATTWYTVSVLKVETIHSYNKIHSKRMKLMCQQFQAKNIKNNIMKSLKIYYIKYAYIL